MLEAGVHVYDRIVIKQKSNIPLVTIAFAMRGGTHHESVAEAGITSLMARATVKGTRARTAAQIAEAAEAMGGSVSPSVGSDSIAWEITVPSKHFEAALELLSDVAFQAAFPERELEIERKLVLADLQHTRDDMYRYPLRLCLQQAFGSHPYGAGLGEVERAITNVTRERVIAWHAQHSTSAPWAFVVGDVAPEKAASLIKQYLSSRAPSPSTAPSTATWCGPGVNADRRDKAQTAIALAFPGVDRNHEDVYPLQVLANAVGGLGGRFFEELRSKRSLAYTVALMPVARWLGGAFVAYIGTAPEREDEARQGLLEQFDRLVNEQLSDEEVERSKRYTIGTWQIRSQTNTSQLGDLLGAYMLGPGIAEITEFEQHVRTVTPEQILAVARKYFDPAVAVEGIVRGKGKANA
jgi:zinc protease